MIYKVELCWLHSEKLTSKDLPMELIESRRTYESCRTSSKKDKIASLDKLPATNSKAISDNFTGKVIVGMVESQHMMAPNQEDYMLQLEAGQVKLWSRLEEE